MEKYSVTIPARLIDLCIRKDWFNCGTREQYEKLMYANEHDYSLREIATIIWLCSDSEVYSRMDIFTELRQEHKQYISLMNDKRLV